MIKTAVAVFCALFFCCNTFAQQLPRYDINVSLNNRTRSLDGLLKVVYVNNSSDSLDYLWFNIYPNAFKSDRTAFSEYLLSKGRTDFYFSDEKLRGYINRLDFRSGDNVLRIEDHPQYIDVIKVHFDKALAPGDSITITTPFHVKVPHNFDGIGYYNGMYTLRYWYPAIANFVKPLTNADSSSNMVGDYSVRLQLSSKLPVPGFVNETKLNDSITVFQFESNRKTDFPLIINPYEIIQLHGPGKPFGNTTNNIKKFFSKPLLPAIGFNEYDGFQLGVLSQDYYQKEKKFNYYVAPTYAFKSKSVAGIAGASYRFDPKSYAGEIELGLTASTFSYNSNTDTGGSSVFAKLFKVVPSIRAKLPSSRSNVEKTISFKSYIISERDLDFVRYSVDSFFYAAEGEYATRYVNELSFDYSSTRVLYPYHAQVQVQQGSDFYRVNVTGNYFFNYAKGGGANVRIFAAKFGYLGDLSSSEKFAAARYQPKLTAVRGAEDYTYSNYFVGRNEFDGFSSQQVMMRDGGLKLRTDLFEGLQGRSDNWIAAMNINTTLPNIFPVRLPLKLFFDAGTYSEAWDPENPNPRFLFVAGLQLSLFKETINVYAPLFYSKAFRDQLKSVPEENTFAKKISFSIDLQKIDIRKLF